MWTFTTGGEVDVYCQFSRTCILPCSFPVGDEVVIHWIQVLARKIQTHSYYHNQDQLGLQNPVYKGRTSLFNDQISKGNASLQLRNVEVRDEGKYQCYTSTVKGNKEDFIRLKVYAPVEEVTMKKFENEITCSSKEIYPRPTLTWTSNHQLDQQKEPTIIEIERKLYKISSSVTLLSDDTDADYSCTISAGKSQKKATLFKEAYKNSSDSEVTVECQGLDGPITYLTWRFNHSQVILTWDKTMHSYTVTDEWGKHVKEFSEKGTLTLQDLTPDQKGTYTCESGNTEETSISSTVLYISADGISKTTIVTIGVIVAVILLLIVVMIAVIFCRKKTYTQTSQSIPKEES